MMFDPDHNDDLELEAMEDDAVDFQTWRAARPHLVEAAATAEPRRQLGRTIAGLRTGRGLTQKQLAAMVGKQQPAIARIENGTTNVGWETLFEIFGALGVAFSMTYGEQDVELVPRHVLDARLEAEFKRGFSEGLVSASAMGSSQVINPRGTGAHERNARS